LLKICLGDSDGNSANNVDVYNWDHGDQAPIVNNSDYPSTPDFYKVNYFQNPHLIKLVDATQDKEYFDNSLYKYPISRLCTSTTEYLNTYNLESDNYDGWCSNINPPGFYAVLYFDSDTEQFRIFSEASQDYSSTTQFHIFTTQGYLQRVSPVSSAFSFAGSDSDAVKVSKYHSSTLHLTNTTYVDDTTGAEAFYYGNVDCETNPIGDNYATDCLNKGDYLMLLDVNMNANSFTNNGVYPNIYQVLKIGREERDSTNYQSETLRHQIVLNTGVNVPLSSYNPATMYKFHPPTTKYNYVAQCSNRGICDNTVGICSCFSGYTNDNCDTQNALVA